MKKISERSEATNPAFFKRLRNAGLIVTVVAAAVLLAPVEMPMPVLSIAGYFFITGFILATACQLILSDTANSKLKRR